MLEDLSKAFENKLPKKYDEAHTKALQIYKAIVRFVKLWEEQERDEQYIPYMSSWLNANFNTIKKTKKRKTQ